LRLQRSATKRIAPVGTVIGTKGYGSRRSVSIHENFVKDLVQALPFRPLVISTGETHPKAGVANRSYAEIPTILPQHFLLQISERSHLRDILRMLESFQMFRLAAKNLRAASLVHWFEHYGLIHAPLRTMYPRARSCITLFSYLRRYIAYDALLKLSLGGFDKIVTTTKTSRDILVRLGLCSGKIATIPLGVDLRYFYPSSNKAAQKRKLGLRSNARVISWFGHITPSTERDFQEMLDIATRASSVDNALNFFFCFKNLPPQIAGLRVSGVRIFGRVEVRSILWATDLVVLPFTEPTHFAVQPLTVIEALACGVPTLALHNQALEETISNKVDGVIVPNTEELLDAIVNTVANEEVLASLGQNARRTAEERFDIIKVAESYLKLWRIVANG
jgi:glycosyltransferase involved in cell wall biosynthesis